MNEEKRRESENPNGNVCLCHEKQSDSVRGQSEKNCSCQEERKGRNSSESNERCGKEINSAERTECRSGRSQKLHSLLEECEETTSVKPEINIAEMQEIYRCATVGKESVDIVRPMSADRGFRNLLLKQYKGYAAIAKEMELYAAEYSVELSNPSVFAKGMMYFTTIVNTIKDKSNGKLAEIMIQGINMGIISMTKVINRLSDEGRTNVYADRMLSLMQENLEEMKLFL